MKTYPSSFNFWLNFLTKQTFSSFVGGFGCTWFCYGVTPVRSTRLDSLNPHSISCLFLPFCAKIQFFWLICRYVRIQQLLCKFKCLIVLISPSIHSLQIHHQCLNNSGELNSNYHSISFRMEVSSECRHRHLKCRHHCWCNQ